METELEAGSIIEVDFCVILPLSVEQLLAAQFAELLPLNFVRYDVMVEILSLSVLLAAALGCCCNGHFCNYKYNR